MCKIGDILLIYNATRNKRPVGAHPFIVLDDRNGIVKGMYSYDFIGLLMSSADTEEKRQKLHKYDGNFPISQDDKICDNENYNNLPAYAKAEQFYYFSKDKIHYMHIARLEPDIYEIILEFIDELNANGMQFEQILDKAVKIKTQDLDKKL